MRAHLKKDKIDEGTAVGAAQRVWLDLKTAVTKNDDKAVLEVVKTGEGKTLEDYRNALQKELPEDVRKIVEKQTEKIESSYDWTLKRITEKKKS